MKTLAVLLGAPLVAAVCTQLTPTAYDSNSTGLSPNSYVEFIGNFTCLTTNVSCTVGPHQEQETFTIHALLNISASASDTSSILLLASQAYGEHSNLSKTESEFIDRNVTVNLTDINQVVTPIPSQYNFKTQYNGTVSWVASMMMVSGVLGGCDNSSLNGVAVTAAAPFSFENKTGLPGVFITQPIKSTKSGAGKRMMDVGLGSGFTGLLTVVILVAMGASIV
jgi:hypothetical protein